MTKTRHQKFLKSEKAKTKLKTKKQLPKGTNITNTTFKAKKIVIREQLKTATGEPLSNRKLSLKELLSRLKHFNVSSRKEALDGIEQLIISNSVEILGSHARELIFAIVPLVLDKEKSVRRATFQMLHLILSLLNAEKISPFFDNLCSHLICAMTHIVPYIQEDSVLYFDVLLDTTPDLIGKAVCRIFPSFLDIISESKASSQSGRTLSVNLGSKMTGVKWRTEVLLRLLKYLKILNSIQLQNKQIVLKETDSVIRYIEDGELSIKNDVNCKTFYYNKEKRGYHPIYRGIQFFSIDEKNLDNDDGVVLKSYMEKLIPLLFDAWLEVKPNSSGDVKSVESVISEEAVTMLRRILGIFLLTWNLLKLIDENSQTTSLSKWFVEKYQKPFVKLIFSSFPYTQSILRNKKNKKDTDRTQSGEKCVEENLMICHIFAILNSSIVTQSQGIYMTKVMDYVKWSFDNVNNNSTIRQTQIIAILTFIFKSKDWVGSKDMIALLEKVISVYGQENDGSSKERLFTFLCNILLNDNLSSLQETAAFKKWLQNLPKAIGEERKISEKTFDTILRFAIKNNGLFNDSIKSNLKNVVKNLPEMEISDSVNKKESRKKLVSLLYWIKNWDVESLNILHEQFESQKYEVDIQTYLVDILKVKTEGMFPD